MFSNLSYRTWVGNELTPRCKKGLLGFAITTVIAACVTDVEAVLQTPFGQPVRTTMPPSQDIR